MKNTAITIIITAFNEEANIKPCIESAKLLTDNIILIDTESTDKTSEIARLTGVKTLTFPFSRYVEPTREFGIEKAEEDWVFILDADERITPELSVQIKKAILDGEFTHYKIPRKELFANKKWLKHGGWWPNHQIRLINKKYFRGWPKEIHSTPVIEGKLGYISEPLVHLSKNDYEKIVGKTIIFEDIESSLLYKAGKDASTPVFFRKYFGELYRRMFKNLGFLDGEVGIIESIYQAFSKTITYLFLYEKKKRGSV